MCILERERESCFNERVFGQRVSQASGQQCGHPMPERSGDRCEKQKRLGEGRDHSSQCTHYGYWLQLCVYFYRKCSLSKCMFIYIYINIPSMQYTLCSIYIHLYRYLYANLPSSNEQIRKGWEHPTVFLFPTRPDDIPSVLWSGLGTALYYAFNFLPARFWELAAELSSSSSVPRKS